MVSVFIHIYGDGTLKSYGGRNCKKKVTERKKLPRGRCLKGKCVFLMKTKKSPCGHAGGETGLFEEKKSPCGHAGGETRLFEEKKPPAGTLVAKPCFFEEKKPLRERWLRNRTF